MNHTVDPIKTVSVIGAGRIGRPVLDYLGNTPGFRPGRILSRQGSDDTRDIGEFLSTPCDLIIECAGPRALRAHGLACLAAANVWTVGAAALADDLIRKGVEEAARANGTTLRLFSPWVAGIGQVTAEKIHRLELRVSRPGMGAKWLGPLREAVRIFPDELNFAVAAALCGPGLDATRVELDDRPEHTIEALAETAVGVFRTSVSLHHEGRHPTAEAIIAALEQLNRPLSY